MSYIEILIGIIIIGVVSVSLSVGVAVNNKSAKDVRGLSSAIEIAKNDIKAHMLGEVQPATYIVEKDGVEYTVTNDMITYDELVIATVNWDVSGMTKEYVLYGTKPDNAYD